MGDLITRSAGPRLLGRCLLLTLSLCAATGCKEDQIETGLVLQVQSDLGMPHDIDMFRIDVTQHGESLLRKERDLPDSLSVPVEFKLAPNRSSSPITVRTVGYKNGTARVERVAITPIPSDRLALLRLPLSYVCLDRVPGGRGKPCDEGQTCKAGNCVDATVPASEMPTYDRAAADTNNAPDGGKHNCLDVLGCFADATRLTVDHDTCSASITTQPESGHLNFALRFTGAERGVCDAKGICWVVLDAGDEGWRVDGARVQLPAALCQERFAREDWALVMSDACPTRRPTLASCTGSSSSPMTMATGHADDLAQGRTRIVPAVGTACEPPAVEACGACGTHSRTCQGGQWSEWTECAETGSCKPNESASCDGGGTKVCGGNCQWGPCEGKPCVGADTEACGRCGTRHRTCNNGSWSDWSACVGQGVCEPNTLQACGGGGSGGSAGKGMQRCGGSCQWGACGDPHCGGAPTQPCERCGTEERQCDAASQTWSEWGACQLQGACTPNEMQDCGTEGKRTCGGDCQWDSVCRNQSCVGPSARACGNCGTSTRSCDSNTGQWSDWSACSNEGACAQGTSRDCGTGGTQTCGGNCQWNAACTGQTCLGPSTEPCGHCGTHTRVCDPNTGTWSAWSSCTAEGECNSGEPMACGNGGTRVCGTDCHWESACTGQGCTGPVTQTCGSCGTQRRTCDSNSGRWSAWSDCTGQGVCQFGTSETCGSGGQHSCTASCQWPTECPNQKCNVPASRTCTKCGSEFSSCNTDTGVASWGSCMNQGECERGTSRPCGGTGTQTCSQSCGWGSCECGQGFGYCQGTCIDLRSDGNNCGACNVRCGSGTLCQAGSCVSRCLPSQAWCGSACTDLQSDDNNCGACGATCKSGTRCQAGVCTAICAGTTPTWCNPDCANLQTDDNHCGDCNTRCDTNANGHCSVGKCLTCGTGQTFCAPDCVDLQSDEKHCGTCANACAKGATCVKGTCITCPTGQLLCGETCVPIATDRNNCGSCGNVCPAGVDCVLGACTGCDASQRMCMGSCTNVQIDNNNCGKCGNVCPDASSCSMGNCLCSTTGLTLCGQSCVNTLTDSKNCGACDNACPASLACSGGSCSVCADPKLRLCGDLCVDDRTNRDNCGRCGNRCPEGVNCSSGECQVCANNALTHCGKAGCVNTLTDPNNCGTCGNVCPVGIACSSGNCAGCTDSVQTFCPATGCTDLSRDNNNCGQCDKVCGEGTFCSVGQCIRCSEGQTRCNDGCFDLRSDLDHCLSCKTVCPRPKLETGTAHCEANGCYIVCAKGYTLCANECVDTTGDVANCGMCGYSCAKGEKCIKGQCNGRAPGIDLPIAGTGVISRSP